MELVKIDPAEYGLEQSKASEIEAAFAPMLMAMTDLEAEYNELIKQPISEETVNDAHNLRLKYVKIRTGTANIHKEAKAFYRAGGLFVDGWKNAQVFASQGIENTLMDIEKYYENQEKELIDKLQHLRAADLYDLGMNSDHYPAGLGEMSDDVWENYYRGIKSDFEARKAAEIKAEEDRIAREKAEEKERKRMEAENIKLKKEAKQREKEESKQLAERERVEAERRQKEEDERAAQKLKSESLQKANNERLEKERKEKESAEMALKEKEEAEIRAKEDVEKRMQDELNKGDSAKVKDLVSDLNSLKLKYEFKSKKNRKMYVDTCLLIDKVITHINK